jgi:hypothetical protein
MTSNLRLAFLAAALSLGSTARVSTAQTRPTPPRPGLLFVARGDTLIQLAGELEIAYLVTPDSVVAISLGGNAMRRMLAPHEAAVMRARWKSLSTGAPLDTALLPVLLRNARAKASTAAPDFRLSRTLSNGMRIDFHGDTIRFVPAKGSAGQERVYTLTAAGAFLIDRGTKRPLGEQSAGLLALLRSNEFDKIDIEAKIAELMRGR